MDTIKIHDEYRPQAYELAVTENGQAIAVRFLSQSSHEALVSLPVDLAKDLAADLAQIVVRATQKPEHP